jgi:fibronectin type 3 domain-containing protein
MGITTLTAPGAPDIFIAKYYSGTPAIPKNFSAIGKNTEVVLSWDPSKEGNVDVYHLARTTDLSVDMQYLVGLARDKFSYTDQDVTNDVTYFYRIAASNSNGFSDWSDYVYAIPGDFDPTAKPAIPENFSAIGKDREVLLSWDPSKEVPVDIYHLVRSTELSEDMPYLVGLPGNIFSYTDRDVTNDTTYIYRMTASNSNGFSGWSDYVYAIPGDVSPPSIPSEFSALAGDGNVTLFWTKSPEINVAMYHLYRSLNGGDEGTYLIGLPNNVSSYVDTAVTNGTKYFYRISASDYNNNFSALSDEISATPETNLSIEETTPADFYYLGKNYPNPFNSSTTISFGIPHSGYVALRVYNIHGDMISTLVDKNLAAGYHSISWDGMDNVGQTVSAGLYFFHLQAGTFSKTNKMILIK